MKLIILDRDGVINYDSPHYIKTPDEFQAIPGSLQAIARLNHAGYRVAVATNQSGVARGFYSIETLEAIHEKMQTQLSAVGGNIDVIYYCPHHPNEHCYCRKPQPGLLFKLAKHYQISLRGVPFLGDRSTDLYTAFVANATPIAIDRGKNNLFTQRVRELKIASFKSLETYVNTLLK